MVNNHSPRRRGRAKAAKRPVSQEAGIVAKIHPGSHYSRVDALAKIVYPPGSAGAKLWGQVKWAHAHWRVRTLDGNILINHVGIYRRNGMVDGAPAKIFGIGGVMTLPERQGQHHATRALAMADDWAMKAGCDFGLLVCEKKNIALYKKLGWFLFTGALLHRQPGRGSIPWTIAPVMVRDLNAKAPRRGTVDLRGKPW